MTRLRILPDNSLFSTLTNYRAFAFGGAFLLAAACSNDGGGDGAPTDNATGGDETQTTSGDTTLPSSGAPGVQPSQQGSSEQPTQPGPSTTTADAPTTPATGSTQNPDTTPAPSTSTPGATETDTEDTPTQQPTEGDTDESGEGSMPGQTMDAGGAGETTDTPTDTTGSGSFDRLAACSDGPYGDPFSGVGTPSPVMGSEGGGDNFYIAEGPVWLDGAVYFSLFSGAAGFPSTIKRYTPGGAVEDFIVDSGSNGLAIDIDGGLLAATHDQQRLSKYDVQSKARSSVVETYMGQAFNSPNDIAVHSNGTIYFTDPDHQNGGRPSVGDKHLYVVQGDDVTAVTTAHSNGGAGPNGVALSPDETTLYVSGSGSPVRRFSVDSSGVLGEEASFTEDGHNGDGMTLDCAGNLYLAVNSEVKVFSPDGMLLNTLSTPAQATNVAFGGPDGSTLYITTMAQGMAGLHMVEMAVPGLPY